VSWSSNERGRQLRRRSAKSGGIGDHKLLGAAIILETVLAASLPPAMRASSVAPLEAFREVTIKRHPSPSVNLE
jgi:hypothetical protein